MIVNFIGGVEHFRAVGRFPGNVIYSMNQDNVIIFTVIIGFDHFIVKFVQQILVLQLASSETKKKFLGAAFLLLFQRKFHIDEIFAESS